MTAACSLEFACFGNYGTPRRSTPPTESDSGDDAAGRFIAHVLVTRVLLAAGLSIDPRVTEAPCAPCPVVGRGWHGLPPEPARARDRAWLPALDPDSSSDRPLPIDWTADCFRDAERWDPEYRLFSHYDVRERALDWAVYASSRPERREGVSMWTIVEPLLRMERDSRASIARAVRGQRGLSSAACPAQAFLAMLERRRIAALRAQAAPRDAARKPYR
ncbi:MAG: hypothetical protein U0360_02865 [Dehalococcoidia bacterium]